MGPRSKCTFVLDTNVVLHDHQCLEHFQEHDVVVPKTCWRNWTVSRRARLDELRAREFIRTLDSLATGGLPPEGLSLG
jgi:PhoH-like ATPase